MGWDSPLSSLCNPRSHGGILSRAETLTLHVLTGYPGCYVESRLQGGKVEEGGYDTDHSSGDDGSSEQEDSTQVERNGQIHC